MLVVGVFCVGVLFQGKKIWVVLMESWLPTRATQKHKKNNVGFFGEVLRGW